MTGHQVDLKPGNYVDLRLQFLKPICWNSVDGREISAVIYFFFSPSMSFFSSLFSFFILFLEPNKVESLTEIFSLFLYYFIFSSLGAKFLRKFLPSSSKYVGKFERTQDGNLRVRINGGKK